MTLFRKIEDKLEAFYESWINKIFKGPIKPGEIAGKAIRAMLRNKKVGINRNYAPNCYQIYLSKEDYLQIQPLMEAFSEEISETLLANAEERNLTILGWPQVNFEIDSSLIQGQVKVKTTFLEAKEEMRPLEEVKNSVEDTLTFNKNIISERYIQEDWSFQVVYGPDKGKSFKIPPGVLTIGRKPENDIVLNDSSISRIHARVKLQNGKLIITDLDSTNGVLINGTLAKESELLPGDEVVLGQSKLKVVKG